MAGMNNKEETSPLLSKNQQADDPKKQHPVPVAATDMVNGLPLGQVAVVGEPMPRTQWDSGLCACLGRTDDFFSSDLEVCVLGSVAPCVLYGGNAERLGLSATGTFATHCCSYSVLNLIGRSLFGCSLAPLFSYHSREAIRRRFNLQGSCESLHNSCGCCGSFIEDDQQREQCESACDFATHVFCHPCALCQEGRELRRRLPHPGFHAQPVLVMNPPMEQVMGRTA